MMSLLLTLMLLQQGTWSPERPFSIPETAAYAQQVKKDVVVAITYTTEIPKDVCIGVYELADTEWSSPTSTVCVDKIHQVGDVIVFKGERIDLVNFQVVVRYPSGKTNILYLVWKLDT